MALKGSKFNASLRIKGNVFSEESAYQQPVLDIQTNNALNPTPSEGDRFLITDIANLSAAFTGITGLGDDDIIEYDGSAFSIVWDASAQGEGAQVYDKDSNAWYQFDGTAWAESSGTVSTDATIDGDGSSGSPLGLADDAVTTAKILDANVTDAKLATGIDAAKLADGSVSNAELQFINSLTSNAQDQIDSKQSTSEKGAANGYASLDANSKIPTSQLPAIAITDVFSVADITARDALTVGTGDGEVQEGDVALVTDASADPAITSGAASYIYNGSSWSLLKAGDEVLSVNGATGTVTVNAINELTGDITAGPASGSQSAAATIAAGAVTTAKLAADAVDGTKLADDAVDSEHLAADAVDGDSLDYLATELRSGALTITPAEFTSSLTQVVTHGWSTADVQAELYDVVTGETCYASITRQSASVTIELNQVPENNLRVLLREVKSETTLSAADG